MRRWTGLESLEEPLPVGATVAAMAAADVETGLSVAWHGRRPIPYIDQVALDFPELTIVCGHIGYPRTTEMIAVADKHARLHRRQRLHHPPLPARTGRLPARPEPREGAVRQRVAGLRALTGPDRS
ncbi:amidohydrolase family protein [Streptomyces sp. NPDC047525]|uniref:amidohydrolase family protein n=1 Tax=Streptomyces sp. NPDC047525 TaxID=3155264 RepID=UPI0033C22309